MGQSRFHPFHNISENCVGSGGNFLNCHYFSPHTYIGGLSLHRSTGNCCPADELSHQDASDGETYDNSTALVHFHKGHSTFGQ